jgi:hypothetical protein
MGVLVTVGVVIAYENVPEFGSADRAPLRVPAVGLLLYWLHERVTKIALVGVRNFRHCRPLLRNSCERSPQPLQTQRS